MKVNIILFYLFFPLANLIFPQSFDRILNSNGEGVALEGYDVVSYFNVEGPVKGNSSYRVNHKGVVYWFVSHKNKIEFLAFPENYLPQYGGWCAYAMAKGEQVEINPEAYLIQEEKLYLFYKTPWINTRSKWLKEPKKLQAKADFHWQQ